MKRLSFFMLFLCFAFALPLFAFPARAAAAPPTLPENAAKACVLVEQETGTILFEKDAHARYAPASITKVMTMLLVAEAIDSGAYTLNDVVTVSDHAAGMGGAQVYLKAGEQMTVRDLLKSVAVASANDAAVALAEFTAGSEEEFVAQMNNKALFLGMTDTHFENSNGLDADNHLTSAYDIAIMSRELLKHEWIKNFTTIWMDSLRDGAFQLVNTNKLVRSYNGITGLKTGFTPKAKYCLTASAERNGLKLIAVVLGGDTSQLRFDGASSLLNYGFSKFVMVDPLESTGATISPVRVKNGAVESLVPVVSGSNKVLLSKDAMKNLTAAVTLPETVDAPLTKGQELGEIVVTGGTDNKEVARVKLVCPEDVKKLSFGDVFFGILSRLVMTWRG